MPDTAKAATPNEELATAIAVALVSDGLVPEERQAELRSKLAAGTAKPEDWNRWIEEVLDASGGADNEASTNQ